MLNLSEVAAQVADEWAAEGKPMTLPPDTPDDSREHEFWDEVQRRYDEQAA